MAKGRKDRTRAIPRHFATGAEQAAATAHDRFAADIDGERDKDGLITFATAHWVIRDREAGTVEDCRTVTRSEVLDRVALLNRGTPTRGDNKSWGLKKKQVRNRRVRQDNASVFITGKSDEQRDAALAENRVMSKDPLEIVELLASHEDTAEQLRAMLAENRALSRKGLESLLEPFKWLPRFTPDDIEAIRKQLERDFGILRSGW